MYSISLFFRFSGLKKSRALCTMFILNPVLYQKFCLCISYLVSGSTTRLPLMLSDFFDRFKQFEMLYEDAVLGGPRTSQYSPSVWEGRPFSPRNIFGFSLISAESTAVFDRYYCAFILRRLRFLLVSSYVIDLP